jgi:hypothetical protein
MGRVQTGEKCGKNYHALNVSFVANNVLKVQLKCVIENRTYGIS